MNARELAESLLAGHPTSCAALTNSYEREIQKAID